MLSIRDGIAYACIGAGIIFLLASLWCVIRAYWESRGVDAIFLQKKREIAVFKNKAELCGWTSLVLIALGAFIHSFRH